VGVVDPWGTSRLTSPAFPSNMDSYDKPFQSYWYLQRQSGAIHRLFLHLLFLTDQMTKVRVALLHTWRVQVLPSVLGLSSLVDCRALLSCLIMYHLQLLVVIFSVLLWPLCLNCFRKSPHVQLLIFTKIRDFIAKFKCVFTGSSHFSLSFYRLHIVSVHQIYQNLHCSNTLNMSVSNRLRTTRFKLNRVHMIMFYSN